MRLPGRAKVWVHAEMEPQRPAVEPHSAASCQIGRLRVFGETEDSCIERSRLGFLPRRHGKLDMVESDDYSQGRWIRQSAGITTRFTSAGKRRASGAAASGATGC